MSLVSEKRIITVNYPKFNFNEENPFKEELDKIVDTGFAEATTTRTIKNITETLTKGLRSKYGIPAKDIKQKVHAILKLHGLAPENFDPISIISTLTFTDKPVNDISVDDNANKTEVNMEGICCEAFLAYKKAVGYDYLYQTIKELYGKEEAKKCSADMYDFSIALNDSTAILRPYCYCVDASKLVMIGRDFGQVHSAPAKYIRTYIATLGDTIREMSFNVAGALAVGSFFLDIAHLAIYKERIPLEDLKTDKKIRKNIINSLQQFIYTVNHYSRNAIESPFTNISLFDREKLRSLVDDSNYGWYFPKKASVIEDNNIEDSKQKYVDFVLDYIEELQEMYLGVFDKGDPLRNGLQFPFPVTTINLGITIKEDGSRDLTNKDNKLLNFLTKNCDISRYNIYCSEGTKVASCCLAATTKILCRIDGVVKYVTAHQLYDIWNVSHDFKIIEIMGESSFVKVLNGFSIKNKSGVLQKITLKGGNVITTTLDHPSVKIVNGDLIKISAQDLRVGDLIPVSKKIEYESFGGDRNLGRYVGLFGAEGNYDLRRNNYIAFSFNTNEEDLHKFIQDYSNKHFGASSCASVSKLWEASIKIGVNSSSAYGLMRDFFNGNLCTDKKLKSRIFNMSEEFRLGFLEGFIEGDGYTADNKRSDYGSIHIANKELGYDLIALANSINIKCSFRNGSNSNDCIINFLHDEKLKLLPLQDWKGGKGKSSILNDYDKYFGVQIENIEQIKIKNNTSVFDFEVESDSHLFQIANGIITHNCRLLSDADMFGMASGVNSFGGSQISLGSHRVVTINLARIGYEAKSYDDFRSILSDRIEETGKILKAHKILIMNLEKLGKQPWITNNWINMSHMFSTFGCLGYVEAAEILKEKFNNAEFDYMKDFLIYFNNECKRVAAEEKIIFNIEAIPGEGMAPKLAKADKVLFADEEGYFNF